MQKPWLRSNRRAIAAGFVVPAVLVVIAVVLAILPWNWWRFTAVVPLIVAVVITWSLWRMMQQPRLAYDNGFLLVYVSGTFAPERVPIEIVECFFLGQAPSLLPQPTESSKPAQSQAIIVRLAESAREWHQRPVRRELGQWCDGYITVRGTWSEPIHPDLVQRLNAQLVEARRGLKQQANAVK
jgi:hypothetical protein